MTQVDPQTVHCQRDRCLTAVAADASEHIRRERSHITQSVKLPWPALSRQTPGLGNKMGKNEGVHNVHTLGFGLGRTGGGSGRIREVFGGVADFQVQESGSSPTSGTHDPSSEGFLL
jgi:hypothetical protein